MIRTFFQKKEDKLIVTAEIKDPRAEHAINYQLLSKIADAIAYKIAEEIYPEFKDKLLGNKGIEKLLNQIRLTIVRKIIEEK